MADALQNYVDGAFSSTRPDEDITTLLRGLAQEDVQAVMRGTARFNWHGELIRAILRQPSIKSVLLHTLLR